jgi:three-Cys-motif partner protein
MSKGGYDWELGKPPPLIEPHTIVKQNIYQNYIEQYIKTLNQNPNRQSVFKFAVVDAFAGGGLYRDANGDEHQGSPVKIIEGIKNGKELVNLNRKNSPFKFKFKSKVFFIEKKKPVFEYLKNHLSNLEYAPENRDDIKIIKDNFENVYLNIVKDISDEMGKNVRSIFILDQYGYADVPFVSIRKIFDLLPNSEVILTLAVNHLIDYISDPEAEIRKETQLNMFSEAEPNKKIEYAKQVKNYVEKLGLDLKELQEDKASYPRTYRGVIQTKLLEKLILLSNAKYYVPFFLGESGNHREMWLVHLSKHPEARSVMTNILHQHANDKKAIISHYGELDLDMLGFIGQKDIIGQPSLFENKDDFNFSDKDIEKMSQAIQEDIPRRLHGKEITFKDFYANYANHCLASKEQLLDISKYLLKLKEIEAIGKKGKPRRSHMELSDIIRLPKQATVFFKK